MGGVKKVSQHTKNIWFLAIFAIALVAGFWFLGNSAQAQVANGTTVADGSYECPGTIPGPKCLLTHVLRFEGWLITMAGVIFGVVADANQLRAFLSMPQIYEIWTRIRDFLNILFIMVLLFSAFSTIFQVEKYSYRKILLNLVLMALLVNFSYPIARFIIDLSNSLMYTLIQSLMPNATASLFSSTFANNAGISKIIFMDVSASYTSLFSAIIFLFIFAVTLLAIALMLLIRMIVLALLIMFSPIAFTGTIIAGVDGGQAGKWWKNLFDYSFFGPIMIFMLYIASALMAATIDIEKAMGGVARTQAGDSLGGYIATMAAFSMPIIILWLGMGVAKSMGIAYADKIMGGAQKLLSGAGSMALNSPYWAFKKTGIPGGVAGGVKQRWDKFKKSGYFGTDAIEEREARIAGTISGSQSGLQNLHAQRVKDAAEKLSTDNMTEAALVALKNNNSKTAFERAAATLELANRGKADASDVNNIKNKFGDNSKVFNQLRNKVKAYDPIAAFATSVDPAGNVLGFDTATMRQFINSNQFDASKLSSKALEGARGAELLQIAFDNNAISTKDLETLRGKPSHSAALNTSLETLAANPTNQNHTEAVHKNIQMAYLAQTGAPHTSVAGNADWQKELYSKANKETFKRASGNPADPNSIHPHLPHIAQHINTGQYKEILMSMNNDARKALNGYIGTGVFPPGSNEALLQNIIINDPYLCNIV